MPFIPDLKEGPKVLAPARHSFCSHLRERLSRRLRADEEGAISVFMVGVIVVLVTIGFAAMLILGSAIADRRTANTSADAAALAAASYCGDKLVEEYEDALRETDDVLFWSHFGKPVSTYCSGLVAEASTYANANNADLTGFRSDFSTLVFTSHTRVKTPVHDTSSHEQSKAYAKLTVKRGVCVRNSKLGVRDGAQCLTKPKVGSDNKRPTSLSPTATYKTRLTAP